MRYIRYAFLLALGACLLIVALANRGDVTLTLLPDELGALVGQSPTVTLPLFIVILGGIVAGVMIGFVWEWLREHKHRAEAVHQRREKERLEREVTRLRPQDAANTDDVLALLEGGSSAR